MKTLDQLRNRFRAQMKSRRGRSLERATATTLHLRPEAIPELIQSLHLASGRMPAR